jgi:hypothetical protein
MKQQNNEFQEVYHKARNYYGEQSDSTVVIEILTKVEVCQSKQQVKVKRDHQLIEKKHFVLKRVLQGFAAQDYKLV